MALIKCSNCGKEISDKAAKCIHCKHSLKYPDKNKILNRVEIISFLILIACIIVLLIIIVNDNKGNNTNNSQEFNVIEGAEEV